MTHRLAPGDVVLTHAQPGSWKGKIIQRGILGFSREEGEDPSRWSHAAIALGQMQGLSRIYESTFPFERSVNLEQKYRGQMVSVWRHTELNDLGRVLLASVALNRAQVRRPYGIFKIPAFAIDAILARIFKLDWRILSRLATYYGGPVVCSQLVGFLYSLVGIHFGRSWKELHPDDISDYVVKEPVWLNVYEGVVKWPRT